MQRFPYALLHMAKCLQGLNRKQEAQRTLQALIAAKPDQNVLQDARLLEKEFRTG